MLQELALGLGRRQVGRSRVGGSRLVVSAEPPEQIGSRGVERVVAVQVERVHDRQRGCRAVDLADRDRLG